MACQENHCYHPEIVEGPHHCAESGPSHEGHYHPKEELLQNCTNDCPCEPEHTHGHGHLDVPKNVTSYPEPPHIVSNGHGDQISRKDYEAMHRLPAGEDRYSPQPKSAHCGHLEPMGPIGPWATGTVTYHPPCGQTGTRPVLDTQSITHLSPHEWKQCNTIVLDQCRKALDFTKRCETDSRNIMSQVQITVDRNQVESTKRLQERTRMIEKFKNLLEQEIQAFVNETTELEDQRQRLHKAILVLKMPESIARECLDRRCARPDSELVHDEPEEELIKELALIAEIKKIYNEYLDKVEAQLLENRSTRERLEMDWSDKRDAFVIEKNCVVLNNASRTTMFRPGAARCPPEQSTQELWEDCTKANLEESARIREKSVHLRMTLNAVLLNAARDIRCQADRVDKACAARAICLDEIEIRLQTELKECLQQLADVERRIEDLTFSIQKLDIPLKVAQSRLSNRHERPNVENCRDVVQKGVLNEVNTIQQSIADLQRVLCESENAKKCLIETRQRLENEIMKKRCAMKIDRQRLSLIRAHIPSANALSGYVNA